MEQNGSSRDLDDSPAELGAPALRAFFQLAIAWRLTEKEQMNLLGLTSQSTMQSWKAGYVSEVSHDTVERISYLLGIFKAINILMPEQKQADAWVRAPNAAPLFGGRSALDRMTSGDVGDLFLVRQYLDSELS
ncbi:MbcA/ParS/Xre antitoxin family protein [Sphingomonas sp. LY54]|nr:MbcA/ParS/Xre antitoxin family protein [Sphingomonas sp. LY54]WRP30285.1 MbcA/ParS/Xre antitoxin family protein [Sphingomonas sp. LY54]